MLSLITAGSSQFQSTLSVRRATIALCWHSSLDDISIHALREESDQEQAEPARQVHVISIHALREESDLCMHAHAVAVKHFNPRSP